MDLNGMRLKSLSFSPTWKKLLLFVRVSVSWFNPLTAASNSLNWNKNFECMWQTAEAVGLLSVWLDLCWGKGWDNPVGGERFAWWNERSQLLSSCRPHICRIFHLGLLGPYIDIAIIWDILYGSVLWHVSLLSCWHFGDECHPKVLTVVQPCLPRPVSLRLPRQFCWYYLNVIILAFLPFTTVDLRRR